MGRPRSHGQRTADALLAAAERLAGAEGPAALSLRRVADDAGTTTRAVYSLFGSKEGLLVALADRGFRLLGEQVKALPLSDDPVEDVVAAGAVAFRRFALEHPALFRIGFQREAVTPELAMRSAEASRMALAQLTTRLERLADHGRLRRHTPMQAALFFHALCEGLAALELRASIRNPDPAAAWRGALRALVLGLAESPDTEPA